MPETLFPKNFCAADKKETSGGRSSKEKNFDNVFWSLVLVLFTISSCKQK